MMGPLFAVFRKELLDSLRDRRSLLSLLLFPLVGPVLMSLVLTQAVEQQAPVTSVKLPVAGADHAPGLIAFLESRNVEIVEPPADPITAIRDQQVDLVLVIPATFGARFRTGRTATVELISDDSRTDTQSSVRRVRGLIAAHSQAVGALRLLAHGVNPALGEAVKITDVDLSTPKKRAAIFLNLIPMFVLLAVFIGSMHSATDSTAGERERGSLEPLLITPIGRRSLVFGKWLAAVVFSGSTAVFTLGCTLLALGRVPVERFGMSLSLAPLQIVGVLVAVLPLALFVAAAQMLVASFARSFKEAQTYMSLMIFIPMLPGLLFTIQPIKTAAWMMLVPVLGQQALLMDVIRGEPVAIASYGVTALSATLAALLCIQATAALFRRERIIFGR